MQLQRDFLCKWDIFCKPSKLDKNMVWTCFKCIVYPIVTSFIQKLFWKTDMMWSYTFVHLFLKLNKMKEKIAIDDDKRAFSSIFPFFIIKVLKKFYIVNYYIYIFIIELITKLHHPHKLKRNINIIMFVVLYRNCFRLFVFINSV